MNWSQRVVLAIGIVVIAVMGVMLPWQMKAPHDLQFTYKGEVLGTTYGWNRPSNIYKEFVVHPELDTTLYYAHLVPTILVVLGLLLLFQSPTSRSDGNK